MANVPTILRTARLATEFGRSRAEWLFGAQPVADQPVYVRGPNKGKLKGYVLWLETAKAGYHVNAGTGVAAGTTVRAWLGASAYTPESEAARGNWFGRVESVCGSMFLLGPRNIERQLRQQEAERLDRLAREEEFRQEAREIR